MYIFVYGSLRYGFELHHIIAKSRFVGLGYIEGYEMYDLGNYPGVIKGDGIVWGEVYEIDDNLIKFLDEVEDYKGSPDDLYIRNKTRVYFDQRRKYYLDDVYFYIYNREVNRREKIEDGDYSTWSGMPVIVNYFAYAENTNEKVLRQRGVENIINEIPAYLKGYKMIFNIPCKYGYCANLIEDQNGKICGYLQKVFLHTLNSLDKAEQHLVKYMREIVKVYDKNDKEYFAFIYVSDYKENAKSPSREYVNIIKEGLRRKWGDECISTGLTEYDNLDR
ncbi:MAG: gamma-glutamylcyclotransferase [Sulfolobaceae archaeon]